MCGTCGCKSAESGKKNCGCGQDPCITFGAETFESENRGDENWCDDCGTWGESCDCPVSLAETFEARENKDGTIVLTENEWDSCLHLYNGNYLYGNKELKLIDEGLKSGFKFEKVQTHSQDALKMIRLYENLLRKRKVRGYNAEMVHCGFCSDIIGTEEEVYEEETIDYEVANGETICVSCGEQREEEYKNDLDPHYSPFYAENRKSFWDDIDSPKKLARMQRNYEKLSNSLYEPTMFYNKMVKSRLKKFPSTVDYYGIKFKGGGHAIKTTKNKDLAPKLKKDAEYHRDSKGRFAEKPILTGSVIGGLALGLIYLMRGNNDN